MFNRNHKNKYLRYVESADEDDNNESDSGRGNIDLIITKLQKQVNPGNIHSGNADVILKMCMNNQDLSSKKEESFINNISDMLNRNIKEKNEDVSQDIGNSVISVNSVQKGIKIQAKPMIDIDISLNDNLKDELDLQEKNSNYVLSTSNSNNKILSRNKIIEGEVNLNTLSSAYLDNSKYFLNKRSPGMLTSISKTANGGETLKAFKIDNNNNNKDNNKKIEENQKKEGKEKEKGNAKKLPKINNRIIKKNNKFYNFFKCNSCHRREWRRRRRCRDFNIITCIRNIFISIIIISAVSFYGIIFFMG
jgi:hypothetical protein